MARGATLILLAVFGAAVWAPSAHATFPGRNGEIAFGYYSSDDDTQSYTQSLVTTSAKGRQLRVRRTCENAACVGAVSRPSYSADGRKLAYGAPNGIAIRTLRTGSLVTTPRLGFGMSDPGFSPDAKRIVVTVQRTPDPDKQAGPSEPAPTDVYVVTLSSGTSRLLARDADQPDWGSRNRILYRSGGDIRVVRPDGGAPRRVAAKAQDPSWAPSGKTVVYSRAGNAFKVRWDGANTRRLTRRACNGPVISPDGRRVLCNDSILGMFRLKPWKLLHELDEDQSGDTSGAGHTAPAWRALRRR